MLAELRRAFRVTELDQAQLWRHTVQRLTNPAAAIKATAHTPEVASREKIFETRCAALDQHLESALRQFEVGLGPADPEAATVTHNTITIGTMTGSNVQQASPGAKQSVEFKINIETAANALAAFDAALASSSLPPETFDEMMADVRTIRAQLAKPSPSKVIVQEAGRSLRNEP